VNDALTDKGAGADEADSQKTADHGGWKQTIVGHDQVSVGSKLRRSSMIRHPVQRQQATGGGEGASAATGVDFSQKLRLAEVAGSGDPIQHGPELRL